MGKDGEPAGRVIESFCEGKYRDGRNEDRTFIGTHFIAVIDGSSAASPIAGRAGGIVAAEAIVDVLEELDPAAVVGDFVTSSTDALRALASTHGVSSPYAAAVVYSFARREIWRIGDCPFGIDGNWNIPPHNLHERAMFEFRRMMLGGYASMRGAGVLGGGTHDALAAVIRDWLAMTKHWVNAADDPFGFAALDERAPPEAFVEVFPVPGTAQSIALASDGAVVSPNGQQGPRDVAHMQDEIAEVKKRDPNCVSLFPYWRGFLDNATYLDDTTLVRIAL